MVAFLISLFISTILGFLAGLGVGGGSLLLIWLTQILRLAQAQARILNLLFYLPAAIIATHFQKQQKTTQPKIIRPGIIAGCSCAAIISLLTRNIDLTLLKPLLGILLIFIGLREIFYRPRKAK